MKDTDIYCKTSAGLDEVRDRTLKLAPRLRTMLIMVDGTRSVTQLRTAASTLAAPEDFLELLLGQGLVELDRTRQKGEPAAQPREAAVAAVLPPTPTDTPAAAEGAPQTDGDGNARFRMALKLMNDAAVDQLGLRAFFLTLKLEKCFRPEDLLVLLPEFTKAIAKHSGPDAARLLDQRVRQLLL